MFHVKEGYYASWEATWRSTSNSINIYNNFIQTSTNNVLPVEIYIMFQIKTNSCSADRREGTELDTLSDVTEQIFLILRAAS